MREIALNDDGDLRLDGQGRLVIIDGAEAVAQRIRVRLRTIRGEWVFDQNLGLPLFGGLIGKQRSLSVVRTIIEREVLGVEGVERLVRLDLSLNRQTRALAVTGAVLATDTEGEVAFSVDRETL